MSGEIKVGQPVKEAKLMAVIHRCGCNDPDSHVGVKCPQSIDINLGEVAYYHKNPVRRFIWHVCYRIRMMFNKIGELKP